MDHGAALYKLRDQVIVGAWNPSIYVGDYVEYLVLTDLSILVFVLFDSTVFYLLPLILPLSLNPIFLFWFKKLHPSAIL